MQTAEKFWFADEMDAEIGNPARDSSARSPIEYMVASGLMTKEEIIASCGKWKADEITALLARKTTDEGNWPAITDVDKLERAFGHLFAQGIVDLWGIDGDFDEEGYWDPRHHADQYRRCIGGDASGTSAAVFYTWDHLVDAVENDELVLQVHGFEVGDGWTRELTSASARMSLQEALEDVGLASTWSAKQSDIIRVPLKWQRRQPEKPVESWADRVMPQFSKVMKKSIRMMGYRAYDS
jgi:hypothetical protein